jgi:ATP-binding cassette subfamily B protein/subfamily B ATP-binding cassette protein MsbA
MIRRTGRQAWPLLAAILLSSVMLALCEGVTFGVIFQAARLLSSDSSNPAKTAEPSSLGLALPGLSALSAGQQFALLLSIAVLLQLLTSLFSYSNNVAAGWFAARCQKEVTPALHRHVLGLSYACASRYRIGDLVNRCNMAPFVVQRQLIEGAQVLSNLLLVLVYLVLLLRITPLLSLVAIAMASAITLLQSQLQPRIRTASQELAEEVRSMASAVTEDIQILRLLHSTAGIQDALERPRQRGRFFLAPRQPEIPSR